MLSNSISMPEEIRAFIAIELPENVKQALTSIQNDLKERDKRFIKWVSTEGMHLTLKFLGDVKTNRIEAIKNALEEVCKQQNPFPIHISDIGAFPNKRRPKVLWVGISGRENELVDLQKRIDDKLGAIGFSKEKRAFSPHLTLARIGERATALEVIEFSNKLQTYRYSQKLDVRITGVSFVRSQLFPTGAVYTTLAKIKFGS